MKVRIDQQQLADAARWGQRHLPDNPAMPQLAALRLATGDSRITISGTDLDTTTHATIDTDVLHEGAVLVSGRLLADIAAALPAGPVDIVADDHQVTATTPGTSYTLPLLDAHNYPTLPAAPQASGQVDGEQLARAIAHCVPAAMPQKDAVGKVAGLGGIHIATTGTQATVSASNRYVIVRHTLDWEPAGPDSDGHLLIPEPVLKTAARGFTGPTTLHAADDLGLAAISSGGMQLVARGIAEPFPDIQTFAQPSPDAAGTITFDPAELAAAARRAALVNDKNRLITLTVGDDDIHIAADHDGRRAATAIDCTTDGDLHGLRIAFNPDYLATALKPLDGTARMWLTTPTKPTHIRAADDQGAYWAVLMPIRLQR